MPAPAPHGQALLQQLAQQYYDRQGVRFFQRCCFLKLSYEILTSAAPNSPAEEVKEDLAQPVQLIQPTSPSSPTDQHREDRPQQLQPVADRIEDLPPKVQPLSPTNQVRAWQYPGSDWRKHPTVKKYQDEAFLFIPSTCYPTESDAAIPLIAWLRQTGRLCSPPRKPLHSGVIRVEGAGWVITLGHMSGALDRMTRLLESKAGQRLMYKGKMHIIWLETSLPLEWLP